MATYQDGGKVKKAARKVESIPEGYEQVMENGVPKKNEQGDIIFKKKGAAPSIDVEIKPKRNIPVKPENNKGKRVAAYNTRKPSKTPGSIKVEPNPTPEEDYVYMHPGTKKEPITPEMAFGYSGRLNENTAAQPKGSVMVNGKPTPIKSYSIPATYDKKTGTWESNTGSFNPTQVSGYYGADGNFVAIDEGSLGTAKYTTNKNFAGQPVNVYDPTTLQSFGGNGVGEKLRREGAKIATNSNQAQVIADVNAKLASKGLGEVKVNEFVSPVNFDKSAYSIDKQVPLEETKIKLAPQKGINTPAVNNPIIDPRMERTTAAFKKGGLVAKYAKGGYTTPGLKINDSSLYNANSNKEIAKEVSGLDGVENELNSLGGTKFDNMSGSEKAQLAGMVNVGGQALASGIDAADRKNGRSSYGGQAASGAVSGAAKGFALGTNPALMSATGGLSAIVAPIALGVLGTGKGLATADKDKAAYKQKTVDEVKANVAASQQYNSNGSNDTFTASDFEANDTKSIKKGIKGLKDKFNSTFAKGGTIKGPGTGTSDSIETKVGGKGIPEGSFIVPAKNNGLAKLIRKDVLGDKKDKVAGFKKGGDANMAVSNGEHLFTPKEKQKITAYLGQEILEKLAPEAEENEDKKCGGLVGKYAKGGLTRAKAATMLHDGEIGGKPITDQQRKYFAVVASGKAKYSNGGNIRNWDWA